MNKALTMQHDQRRTIYHYLIDMELQSIDKSGYLFCEFVIFSIFPRFFAEFLTYIFKDLTKKRIRYFFQVVPELSVGQKAFKSGVSPYR